MNEHNNLNIESTDETFINNYFLYIINQTIDLHNRKI